MDDVIDEFDMFLTTQFRVTSSFCTTHCLLNILTWAVVVVIIW